MRKLTEKGLKPGLKWTTRPERKFEKQGITYNFVKNDEFINAINESKFLAYQKFDIISKDLCSETWYYGITNDEFNESQIFIMTPSELMNINSDQRKECFIVYLDIPRSIRESRILRRDDKNDSIIRRLDADDKDFNVKFDFDLRITDADFLADDIYDLMI